MITDMSEADKEMVELFRQAWEVEAKLPAVYPMDQPNNTAQRRERSKHLDLGFKPSSRRSSSKTLSVAI